MAASLSLIMYIQQQQQLRVIATTDKHEQDDECRGSLKFASVLQSIRNVVIGAKVILSCQILRLV